MPPTLTEQEVRAFVGKNADRYWEAWLPAIAGDGRVSRFNFSACLLAGFWFGYRKMYKAAFVYFGVVIAQSALWDLLLACGVFETEEGPNSLDPLFCLAAAIFCGFRGNRWYLSHARRVIDQTRARGLSEEMHLRALAERGGTSNKAAFCAVALAWAAAFSVGFALGIVEIAIVPPPPAEKVAEQFKERLAQEWRADLEFRDATIQRVDLRHLGQRVFEGTVEFDLDEQKETVGVIVEWDREDIYWEWTIEE